MPGEGVEISLSTLADQVRVCAVALQPIHDLIRAHVLSAERLHADDTTVPLLAKGGTQTARLWTYLRDDRPFADGTPPAALCSFSTDRRKEHPTRHLAGWTGILQGEEGHKAVRGTVLPTNAYGGYNDLYHASHKPAPVLSAFASGLEPVAPSLTHCWSHARRKLFELAGISPDLQQAERGCLKALGINTDATAAPADNFYPVCPLCREHTRRAAVRVTSRIAHQ